MKRLFIIPMLFSFAVAVGQEGRKAGAATGIPAGYGDAQWGARLSAARDNVKGKLVHTDDKSVIITRDGDLEYHYGFFYIDPALAGETPGTEPDEKPGGEVDEGTLFYVALKFPYLSLDEVKKRIEEKFGPSTNENIHNNQGAIAWNGDQTVVILWVDRYEGMPYCRRITYLDKRITKELRDYRFKVFNRVELGILRNLGI